MNLADALYPEVQRIIVLLTNRRNPFLQGWPVDGWTRLPLTATTARYEQGDKFVQLDNILPIDNGFSFGSPVNVDSVVENRHFVDRVIIRTPDKVDRDYSYTFGELRSELDSIKDEFASKAGARIGPAFDGPGGANFEQAITKAYEHAVTTGSHEDNTIKYHLDIAQGPVGRLIEAVRRTQVQTRAVSDDAHYEYHITVGNKVRDAVLQSSYQVEFASKAEFLDVMRGRGTLDKAMYRHRSWVPLYSGENAQPNAAIDNVRAGDTVSARHTSILFQDFVVTELDPFDAQYD